MTQRSDVADNITRKRRIALGVTGGIAAYKTAELVRLLTRSGYEVFPIMTHSATRFLGPLTLEALSGHHVRVDTPGGGPSASDGLTSDIEHVSLIRSVDLLVIAPLTANTLAKMACGLADNFLTATYLAHRGATLACPAMNTGMFEHPTTERNLAQLEKDGVVLCYGDPGWLACGEEGMGRMADPEVIADFAGALLVPKIPILSGKRVLVSAGPTREDLDPVRFLTNRSSGKMGVAVARAFRNAGARVTLVHGPMHEPVPHLIQPVAVRTSAEMAQAVLSRAPSAHIVVMSAAVADYRPVKNPEKLKKDNFDGILRLEPTTDILAALSHDKPPALAGFAAETEHVLERARAKRERKNLDFIFANDISSDELGFASEENHLWAIDRNDEVHDLGRRSKDDLARQIVQLIASSLGSARK